MVPDRIPPRVATPARSGRPQRWLAWASFMFSVVFPVTYVFLTIVALVSNVTPSGGNPFVAGLYTIFDYFEWPLPILAVIAGHIAVARGGPGRNVALVGLILGYLSILTLLGTVIALTISSATNTH